MTQDDPRFWAMVEKSDECWLWTGMTSKSGYGLVKRAGRRVRSHRYVLVLSGVSLDPSDRVDHTCHVLTCVRPSHLRMVTVKQNAEHRVGANVNSKSGVRGVFRRKNRWVAAVQHRGQFYRKSFLTIEEAQHHVVTLRNELFTHNDADRKEDKVNTP